MSDLDAILNGEKPSPNEAEAAPSPVSQLLTAQVGDAPASDGVEAKSLEVGGLVIEDGFFKDAQGNSWAVPADNVEDFDDLYAGDVYKIPDAMARDFHIQLIPKSKIQEYALRKFVPVTLDELNIPKELQPTTGSPLDRFHVVGDAILVKIPKPIFERINQRKVDRARKRLEEMEPTAEMLDKAKRDGVYAKITRNTKVDIVDPASRQGIYTGDK